LAARLRILKITAYLLLFIVGILGAMFQTAQVAGAAAKTVKSKSMTAKQRKEWRAAVVKYSGQLGKILESSSDAKTELSLYLTMFPNLNDVDILEAAAKTVVIEECYAKLTKLKPPTGMGPIHARNKESMKFDSEAMTLIRSGIDNKDQAQIDTATQLLKQSMDKQKQAMDLTKKFYKANKF